MVFWDESMSGPPKLEYEAIYHIWNRGVNRQNIFLSDDNYQFFLQTYGQHVAPVAETLAYCLLPNHFHLVVRTRTAGQIARNYQALGKQRPLTPSQAFANCFNSYVKAFNRWAQRTGGLFEGRFGRKKVTSQRQLINLITYVHRNPQTHGLIDDYRQWRYSSYGALVGDKATRLCREDVLALYGGHSFFVEKHQDEIDERVIDKLVGEDFV